MLAALAMPQALAKDPCKSMVTHETAFGDTMRGRVLYVGAGRYLAISLTEEDGALEFRVMYVRAGDVDEAVAVGTMGDIRLADGTTLTLPSSEEASPVTNANSTTVFTQWQIPYAVDAATLAKLASSPVIAVRTEIGESLSFEIKEKKSKRLVDVAKCFQSG